MIGGHREETAMTIEARIEDTGEEEDLGDSVIGDHILEIQVILEEVIKTVMAAVVGEDVVVEEVDTIDVTMSGPEETKTMTITGVMVEIQTGEEITNMITILRSKVGIPQVVEDTQRDAPM